MILNVDHRGVGAHLYHPNAKSSTSCNVSYRSLARINASRCGNGTYMGGQKQAGPCAGQERLFREEPPIDRPLVQELARKVEC